jgi:WD40 repeat protein
MSINKVKRQERSRHRTFLGGRFDRFFKHVQPLDITAAAEITEKSPAEGEELEPVIIDLVSGKRVPERSKPAAYVHFVRIGASLLILGLIVAGIILLPARQSKPTAQISLHVIFSASHLGNLSLSAWADDSFEEEIYSGFGPPEYYGVICYAKSSQPGVCGDQHLSFVDNQGHLYTWDKSTGKLTRKITFPAASASSPAPDWSWLYPGQYILAHEKMPDGSDIYKIWDIIRNRLLFTGSMPLLSLASDGRWIAAYAAKQQQVQIIDGIYGEGVAHTFSSPYFAHLVALSWSPDTSELATVSDDGTIQIWSPFTGKLLRTWSDLQGIFSTVRHVDSLLMSWSPDSQLLAVSSVVAGKNLPIHIWNASTRQLLLGYAGHTLPPTSITWVDDGQEILSSNTHETLLWSADTGRTLVQMSARQLSAPPGYYVSQSLIDEPFLAVPSGSNMQVLDLRTGTPLQTLSNEEGNYAFLATAWNPDEATYPVAVDQSGDLLIWNTHPWQVVAHYQLPCTFTSQTSAQSVSLAWSPDGKMLAVDCGRSGLVVLGISWQ